MAALISLHEAGVRYGRSDILHSIDLEAAEGETTVLLGRNGSGKSTLLRLLGGLLRPATGSRIEAKRRGGPLIIGYAPDRLPVMPFGCAEYVRRLGEVRGIPSAELDRTLGKLLERFGMSQHASVKLKQCSKGMLQKVNLMQALVIRPDVLLLDEPLSGLDQAAQHVLAEYLMEMKQAGTTIVYAAHEAGLAEMLADHAIVLDAGRIALRVRAEELASGAAEIDCRFAGPDSPPLPEQLPGRPEAGPVPGGIRYRTAGNTADALLAALLEAGGSIQQVRRSDGWSTLLQDAREREGA